MTALITGTSVLCSAGRGAEQLWASVRAGIARIGSSGIMDRHFEPIRMGLVPDEALEPQLPPQIDSLPLPSRARRMLRLAAPALRTILEQAGPPPIRLYLGLPQLALDEAPWMKGFALYLARTAGASLDAPGSRVVPTGRAAALSALELALAALEADPSRPIVVGGVDSFLDPKLLAELDDAGRLLSPRVADGFIPGEGAAFVILSHSSALGEPRARVAVQGAASVTDPGHRTGTEPARGEGLARAIETLRGRLAQPFPPVATTFAGFNGESLDAKQWGIACLRHQDFFAPGMLLAHPADCCGDPGAAMGGILVALAAQAIAAGQRAGPALVWAASDGESRACALLSATVV